MNLTQLGDLIASARRARDLTPEQLVERGAEEASLRRIESGRSIRVDQLLPILELTGLEIREESR